MQITELGKYRLANGKIAEVYRISGGAFPVAGGLDKQKNVAGVEIYQLKTLWKADGTHCSDVNLNIVARA